MSIDDKVKTKFNSYVSFGKAIFDTTPEADNDDGQIEIPVVSLDGQFTIEDIEMIHKLLATYSITSHGNPLLTSSLNSSTSVPQNVLLKSHP